MEDFDETEYEIEVEQDVEEIEFGLFEDEIDEWINELTKLKEDKTPVSLMIDEETFLKINYEDDEEDGEEE